MTAPTTHTPPLFIFLDLETSCLSPHDPNAKIFEIALVAVDNTLTERAHWHSPIVPSNSGFMGDLSEDIIALHTRNGLLPEIRGERSMRSFEHGGLPNLKQAEAVACQFVDQFGPPPHNGLPCATLAGFNPKFDLDWIAKHMPTLRSRFHYRPFDANALWMAKAWLTGQAMAKAPGAHRSLDDCRAAVRVCREFFGLEVAQCPTTTATSSVQPRSR
jgi:oligoribonuclease (3'-5' exoribonuclease)